MKPRGPGRPRGRRNLKLTAADVQQIRTLYTVQGLTTAQVGAAMRIEGCPLGRTTIRRIMARERIPLRPKGRVPSTGVIF